MPLDNSTPPSIVKKPAQSLAAPQQSPEEKKQEVENFLECIAKYNTYGSALKRATTMQEVGSQLAQIAELAEAAVVSEAEDWFDAHTLKRNMKEIKTYAGDFVKLAQEADMINQRMTALYDDMGRILERYFEIPDSEMSGGSQSEAPLTAPSREQVPLDAHTPEVTTDEDMLVPSRTDGKLPTNPSEPALPSREEMGKTPAIDRLTLRAIQAVYRRLKMTNPAMASKFAKLPPQKMEDVVWRLVK
jgi:hypothetical protein